MGSDNLFHKNKIRKAKDLARRAAKRAPYETILIVCEGTKTECNYLRDFCRIYKLNTANIIVISATRGSAPISIINYAIEYAENTLDIDHVICLFDRDEHQSYQQALDKIKNHKPRRNAKSKPKYHAITSTPCFEIWLLLHFTYSTRAFYKSGNKSAGDNLIDALREYMPRYVKNTSNLFSQLQEKLPIAIQHAKQLTAYNQETKSVNPSTNVNELMERLINLIR